MSGNADSSSVSQGRDTSSAPLAYIAIHDKTPMMRVLYASSNIRRVLQFEPSEVVGQPALAFVNNGKADDYVEQFGRPTNDTVLISDMVVDSRDATPTFLRIIHFSCDNLEFNVALKYPDMAPASSIGSRAPQPMTPADVSQVASAAVASEGRRRRRIEQRCLMRRSYRPRGQQRAFQACLVLERQRRTDETVVAGPRIVFASASFERIVGVDASDLQGVDLLTLVVPDDVVKTAEFLDRAAVSEGVELDTFRFAMCDSPDRHVAVEVIGAGSDDGAVLLCQPDRASLQQMRMAGQGSAETDGYMSLEEIVSSDPETSDFSDIWQSLAR
ncbi:hypothetical protein H4R99_001249 [Coemansia sp. RSA 1722]|nr:hypothetical protein LPJ57_003716 [Coemansia sp. RSA 486]KAJ2595049.1 hypothetical protein GGF39_003974 [Coemansia sp. RSA 1721]KAJ2605269.1 hypothetical protein H4R99_001249 [Coemansia sp. RSA 1722]